ncbi:MAG: TerB family tellurite resistance protein [Gemmatimonadota bacterium]|nr:MAG: TerB family tellurite resistance protein [Gemmatimonadota bacterium]
MRDAIKSFFGSSMAPDPQQEAVPEQDIRLAACALLLELAHADDEFTDDEAQHLEGAIGRQYGLDRDQAVELIALAEKERVAAVDLWQFTKLIKESYSLGQKMVLVEVMWGLVYSDGELSSREEYVMRKVCKLLDIAPGYLADVRKRLQADAGDPAERPADRVD